jgi:cytochrome P450
MSLPLFPFEGPRSVDPPPLAMEMQAVDPVPYVRLPTGHAARLATRYDDVRHVLTMSTMDSPGHVRPVSGALTVDAVEALRPRIELVVDELLAEMTAKGAPADLVAGLATPMPAMVTRELLGIPGDGWPHAATHLFGAGQEAIASQLAASVLVLTQHPDQWDRLVADPAVVPSAVEELLRYVGLGHAAVSRTASADLELSGVAVRAGETIFPLLGVANRDPVVFPDPGRFDVTREDAGPHLAFGSGVHSCLGAPLARLELTVALTALATTFPALRLADPDTEPDWNPGGLGSLVVTW